MIYYYIHILEFILYLDDIIKKWRDFVKKQLLLFISFALILSSGCQSDTNPISSFSPSNNAATAQVETTLIPSPTVSPIEQRADADFRNAKWGDDLETVKKYSLESSWIDETENIIVSEASVLSKDAQIGYTFDNNILYQGVILFCIDHANTNLYIDDFNQIKTSLTEKYGTPKMDKEVWKDDLYKGDTDDYGIAIACGHLQYINIWETENTEIILALLGDNYEISLGITYTDSNHVDQVDTTGI